MPITQLKKISNRKRKQKGAYGEKAREKVVVNVQQKEDVEYLTNKSIYCLEPYKTLYLSYEGAAYPCCFKKSQSMWGDLNNNDAMQIWHSELMASLRDHVRKQSYPVSLCSNCMKTHAYPKRNSARSHALHYARWLEDKYALPKEEGKEEPLITFDVELTEKIKAMPDWNQELFNILNQSIGTVTHAPDTETD